MAIVVILSSLPPLPSLPSPPSLRIRVVGLDNFRNSDVEVVYIEAGIYDGGELLVGEKFTSEVTSTTYPRWNQWLVFDITVKNLPKVGACYSSFSLSPPVFSPLSPFPNFPLPPLSSFTSHQSSNRRLSIQIPFLIFIPRLVCTCNEVNFDMTFEHSPLHPYIPTPTPTRTHPHT